MRDSTFDAAQSHPPQPWTVSFLLFSQLVFETAHRPPFSRYALATGSAQLSCTNPLPTRTMSAKTAARSYVTIDSVLHAPDENQDNDNGHDHDHDHDHISHTQAHPSLVVFQKGTSQIPSISLSLKKRKRTSPHSQDDPDDDSSISRPHLFGSSDAQTWHAAPGFNEMNTHHYIAVHNRRTGKTRLIQAPITYRLRRRTGPQHSDQIPHPSDSEEEELTYIERRQQLLDAFGGRKAQLRSKRYQRDRITEDKVDDKTATQVTIAARSMLAKDKESGISHSAELTTEHSAPPHESNATAPHLAYPLLGLMTPVEFTAVEAEAQALLDGAEGPELNFENPGWRPLVWDLLKSIVAQTALSIEMRLLRVQAAMYLHYLIVLSNVEGIIGKRNRQDLLENMAVSEDVFDHILQRFTSPTDRTKDQRVREKCSGDNSRIAMYAVLMWVTALGFANCSGLERLSVELGSSTKLLANYAITMACKVKKQKGSTGAEGYRVSLKVPLQFPMLRKKLGKPQKRA